MSELEQMLNDYAVRKVRGQAIDEEERKAKAARLEKTLRLFRAVILPEVKEIAAVLKAKGHCTEVKERLEDTKLPSVELDFGPCPPDKPYARSGYGSTLRIAFADQGWIEVHKKVRTQTGEEKGYHSNTLWQLDNLSVEEVRSETMAFVAAVLKAN